MRRKKWEDEHRPAIRSFVSTTNATVDMAALTVTSVHVASVAASARAPVRAQRAVNAKAPARVSASSAFMGGAERRALAVSARRAAPARGFEVDAQAISEVRYPPMTFRGSRARHARRVASARVVPVDVALVISHPRTPKPWTLTTGHRLVDKDDLSLTFPPTPRPISFQQPEAADAVVESADDEAVCYLRGVHMSPYKVRLAPVPPPLSIAPPVTCFFEGFRAWPWARPWTRPLASNARPRTLKPRGTPHATSMNATLRRTPSCAPLLT